MPRLARCAVRCEFRAHRIDTRAGHYDRKFHSKAGEVNLKVPKLRKQTFETAIIECYKRRETPIEEALIEMYSAGISVRRVEDITKALWRSPVSSGTVSKLNKKVYGHIDAWRNQPIEGEHLYVYLDRIVLKRTGAGEIKYASVPIATGIDQDGYLCILGVQEGHKEDKSGRSSFLERLKSRGLKGMQLIVSDARIGLMESVVEYYPEADGQRCMVHFYRNLYNHVPLHEIGQVTAMLKAIYAQERREAAFEKAGRVVQDLKAMRLDKDTEPVKQKIDESLIFCAYPSTHWLKIRTNNPMDRIMREIRRRTRVVGAFPDRNSAVILVSARLRHIASSKWGVRRYVSMEKLKQQDLEAQHSAWRVWPNQKWERLLTLQQFTPENTCYHH